MDPFSNLKVLLNLRLFFIIIIIGLTCGGSTPKNFSSFVCRGFGISSSSSSISTSFGVSKLNESEFFSQKKKKINKPLRDSSKFKRCSIKIEIAFQTDLLASSTCAIAFSKFHEPTEA